MSNIVRSILFSALMFSFLGCGGGGESAPEAGVLDPGKKTAPGGPVDAKTGKAVDAPAGAGEAAK
ncbi:MAG: hypothetical protein RJA81_2393 [Planctomycetota bacterium]